MSSLSSSILNFHHHVLSSSVKSILSQDKSCGTSRIPRGYCQNIYIVSVELANWSSQTIAVQNSGGFRYCRTICYLFPAEQTATSQFRWQTGRNGIRQTCIQVSNSFNWGFRGGKTSALGSYWSCIERLLKLNGCNVMFIQIYSWSILNDKVTRQAENQLIGTPQCFDEVKDNSPPLLQYPIYLLSLSVWVGLFKDVCRRRHLYNRLKALSHIIRHYALICYLNGGE